MLLSECPTCMAHTEHHGARLVDSADQIAKLYVGPDKASVERTLQIYMSMFHTLYQHLTPIDSEDPRSHDMIGMPDGAVLEIHNPSFCAGLPCAIHNPTEHPLSYGVISYNGELKRFERMCEHGINHPDRDNLAWLAHIKDKVEVIEAAKHPKCDGCCTE